MMKCCKIGVAIGICAFQLQVNKIEIVLPINTNVCQACVTKIIFKKMVERINKCWFLGVTFNE